MHIRILFLMIMTLSVTTVPSFAQQTCKSASITATTSHLVGNADGTVSDGKTKLMWKRCPEGFSYNDSTKTCSGQSSKYIWNTALTLPAAANAGLGFANKTGWRLPNIKELQSIVEEQCYNPALRADIFPITDVNEIWSNSPAAAGLPNATGSDAWYVDFYYGEMLYQVRSQSLGVRLVRDLP